jgi:hypothetical protein
MSSDHGQFVTLRLSSLKWKGFVQVTGGPGDPDPPKASPYLWIVFFKIDGETVQVTAGGTLSGQATVVSTKGSHGNLAAGVVHVGDTVSIPSGLGEWSTLLVPIPVDPAITALTGNTEFPATIGFVAVVMTQENVTDQAAEAGHQALNAGVQAALSDLLAGIKPGNQMISDDDINNAVSKIPDQVSHAIENAQSFSENLSILLTNSADKEMGHKIITWSQPQLQAPNDNQNISFEVGSFSFWETDGTLNAVDLCDVTSAQILVSRKGGTHCTSRTVVAGTDCAFVAVTSAPMILLTRTFKYDWEFVGAEITTGADQQKVNVAVADDINKVTATVTITDNFGCKITKTHDFDVISQQTVEGYDKLCGLIDEVKGLQSSINRFPLNPAGPDPGPERVLIKLNTFAKRLVAATEKMIRR